MGVTMNFYSVIVATATALSVLFSSAMDKKGLANQQLALPNCTFYTLDTKSDEGLAFNNAFYANRDFFKPSPMPQNSFDAVKKDASEKLHTAYLLQAIFLQYGEQEGKRLVQQTFVNEFPEKKEQINRAFSHFK